MTRPEHRALRGAAVREDLAAVLFDMDGTLVDSEPVWQVALMELAASYGATLSDEVHQRIVGTSSPDTIRLVLDHIGQTWRDPDEGAAWLNARARELFAAGLAWRPGACELIDAVRAAGIPTALVTNTQRDLVEVALGTLGAWRFDAVVCGDDVSHTKPHPEPYLTAAALLGVVPDACVAIEDSPTGVASAAAAGCAVLAVPNLVELSDVDATVVASLSGVGPDRLAALLRLGRP